MVVLAPSRHSNIDTTPNDYIPDTFAQTWGATTQWKNGGHREPRLHSHKDTPDSHLINTNLGRSTIPPSKIGQYSLLDKPLPPLPIEAVETRTASNSKISQETIKPRTKSNEFSLPQITFEKDSLGSSRKSSENSFIRGMKRKSIFQFARKKAKTQPMPTRIPMVDKGTQTTPTREVPPSQSVSIISKDSSSRSNSPRTKKWGMNLGGFKYADPSPTAGLSSPLWSPRSLLKGTGPSDYFTIPADGVDFSKKANSMNEYSTHRPSETRYYSQPNHPQSQHPGTSVDTLGTYESRYSTRPSISQVSFPISPSLHERTTSARHPSSSSQVTSYPDKRPNSKRLMLPPFPRFASRRGSRHYNSTSSTRSESPGHGPISPLRQEVSYNDDNDDTGDQAPSVYFRMPIFEHDTLHAVEANVPEHLLGSPLCPMHPKHKSGGLGVCPFHGRRESATDSITGDGEYDVGRNRSSDDDDRQDDMFWRNVVGEARRRSSTVEEFKFKAVEHGEGSVLCPAHPRYGGVGRGVCVFHGRGKLFKLESDDSVPRFKMMA